VKEQFLIFFGKENEKSLELFWNILFLKWNLSNFKLFFSLGSPHVLKLPLYYILYLLNKLYNELRGNEASLWNFEDHRV